MPQNERVLITFEGKDTGLASTAKNASESVRRFTNDIERLKKRAPALKQFRNALSVNEKTLANMTKLKATYDAMVNAGTKLSAIDKRRHDALKKSVEVQGKRVSNLRTIVRLRDEDNMAWNEAIQKAKQLQSLEARISSNRDMDITRSKTMERISAKQQDKIVGASVDEFFGGDKGAKNKLANWLGGGTGGTEALMGKITQGALKMTSAFALLAVGIKAVQMAFKLFTAALKLVANTIKIVVKGLGNYIKFIGKIATIQGRAAMAVGRFAKSLWGKIRALQTSRKETEKADGVTRRYGANLRGLVGTVNNLNRSINIFGASIRQIGQAVQNAGVLLTIYISIPVTRALKQWTTTALEFDEALIEVRKNTNLEGKELEALRQGIMELAATSPTDIVDLTNIAADAARMGVAEKDILDFVDVINMLAVATTITAEDGATAMGRLLNIFFGTGDAAKQLEKDYIGTVSGIGSAINELGRHNAVTEDEILAATMRMAPAANALGITIQDALALSATVAGASASAERAGTQLNAALTKIAVNIDKIAAAAGQDLGEISKAFGADPIENFVLLADAIASIEDPIKRQQANAELFGLVGGKAVNIMGAAYDDLRENMEISNRAFEAGTSLLIEYNKAQDAVSNQVKILKNNLKILGITIGEAVLPQITKMLTVVIPLVQALTKQFDLMSDQFKTNTVLIMVMVAVLGPLSYALGSILFQIGIFTTGMTGLISMFAKAIQGPLTLAMSLLGLLTPLRLIIVALTAVIGAILVFGNTLGAVGLGVQSFAQGLFNWGYAAMIGFAEGITKAAMSVYNTIAGILTQITRLLQGIVPGKDELEVDTSGQISDRNELAQAQAQMMEGAGTEIGEATGEAIVDAINDTVEDADTDGVEKGIEKIGDAAEDSLDGIMKEFVGWGFTFVAQLTQEMLDADLSAVTAFANDFGGEIRNALSGLSSENLGDFSDIFSLASGIFSSFAGLFDIPAEIVSQEISFIGEAIAGVFNAIEDGGSGVGDVFEGLRRYIGDFADDLEKLLEVTVAYRQEEEKLLEIKERLEDFDKGTAKILLAISKRTDLTAFERAALMRKAKGDRMDEKEALIESRKEQEKKVKAAKEEVSAQKELINILKSFIPSVSGGKKKKKDGTDFDIDFDPSVGALDEASSALDEATEQLGDMFDTFAVKIGKAKQYIIGLISGFLGTWLLDVQNASEVFPEFWKGLEEGTDKRNELIPWWDDFAKKIDWVQGKLTLLATTFDVFVAGVRTGFDPSNIVLPEASKEGGVLTEGQQGIFAAGAMLGSVSKFFDDLFVDMQKIFLGGDKSLLSKGQRILKESWEAFMKAVNPEGDFMSTMSTLGDIIRSIGEALAEIGSIGFDNLPVLAGAIGTIVDKLIGGGAKLMGVLDLLVQLAKYAAGGGGLGDIASAAMAIGGEGLAVPIVDSLSETERTGENILGTLDFGALGMWLAEEVNKALAGFLDNVDTTNLSNGIGGLVNLILGFIGNIDPELVGKALSTFPNMLIDAIGQIDPALVKTAATNFINTFLSFAEQINFTEGIDSIFAIAQGIVDGMAEVNWERLTGPMTDIAKGILGGLAEFNWGGVTDMISGIVNGILKAFDDPKAWNDAEMSLNGVKDAINDGLEKINWEEIKSKIVSPLSLLIKNIIEGIDWDLVFENVGENIGGAIWRAIQNAIFGGTGITTGQKPEQATEFTGNPIADFNRWRKERNERKGGGASGGGFGGGDTDVRSTGLTDDMDDGAAWPKGSLLFTPENQKILTDSLVDAHIKAEAASQSEIAKLMKKSGGKSGEELGGGIEEQLSSDPSYYDGTTSGYEKWWGSGQGAVNDQGTEVGTEVGFGVEDILTDAAYMDSLPAGLSDWVRANAGALESVGIVIGGLIAQGVSESLTGSKLFGTIVDLFKTWVVGYGAALMTGFFELGKELRSQFMLGFSGGSFMQSLMDSSAAIESIMDIFDAVDQQERVLEPAATTSVLDDLPDAPTGGVADYALAFDPQQGKAAIPPIQINVDGFMSNGEVDVLAELIWDRIEHRIKYAG